MLVVDVSCMVGVHAHMSVEARGEPDAIFNGFPPSFWRQGRSLNLELADSPIQSGGQAPRILLSLAFPALELQAAWFFIQMLRI